MFPQWINSTHTHYTWLVDDVGIPLIVGFILIGTACVFTIIFVERRRERKEDEKEAERIREFKKDSKRVYNWLYASTEKYRWAHVGCVGNGQCGTRTDPHWRSVKDIASCNGLTVERTSEICYTCEKITLMTIGDIHIDRNTTDKLEERWAITEFVR
jgi:hypothetical protein